MANMTTSRYTIQDFNDIAHDGFDYTIGEDTLDIISALASQVGAPDYIRTPNFSTHHREGSKGRGSGSGGGGRRRKPQEMSDEDWEDLRTFHTKPKAEISPEKALEKKLRGVLNRVVSASSKEQLESIENVFCELLDAKLSDIAEKVFYDLATCSKMNTSSFAMLFADLTKHVNDEDVYEFLESSLERFISDDGIWMSKFNNVEYISEDEDYDSFCDVNKTNDVRLNTTMFVAKVFELFFEREDERFMWIERLANCYWKMFCGFKEELRKVNNEDVSMIYCSNIIALMKPINEYIVELDETHEFWNNVIEDQEQIIISGDKVYPSLTRQIIFALQNAFLI